MLQKETEVNTSQYKQMLEKRNKVLKVFLMYQNHAESIKEYPDDYTSNLLSTAVCFKCYLIRSLDLNTMQ